MGAGQSEVRQRPSPLLVHLAEPGEPFADAESYVLYLRRGDQRVEIGRMPAATPRDEAMARADAVASVIYPSEFGGHREWSTEEADRS